MRTKLENLFIAFENKHHSAVEIDTEMTYLDYDDNKWVKLENKSKQSWNDCNKARKEFMDELAKVDPERIEK